MVHLGESNAQMSPTEPSVPRRHEWTRLRRQRLRLPQNASLLIGGGIVGVYILAIFFAPIIARHSPDQQDVSAILAGPSSHHWLGTDQIGRDVWARLVYSVRIDVPVSILAVVVPFVVGTLLGMVAGHGGGVLDAIIMRIADVVLAFPFMVLVIAFVFVFGSGVTSVFIAFSATGWVSYTIIARGESITESNREYVLAARTLGYPRRRILLRHLLPNVITQGLLYAMSDIVMTVTSIVGLGFLGLGIRPPTPEWGSMIADGTPFITTHWLIATAPGLAVVVFGIGLSMIGDGLASLLKAG
jgi:peptide/nickel transport system permease protein